MTPEEPKKIERLEGNLVFYIRDACIVWNKEFLHDVTNKAEILLISAKGNPAMIFKESESYRNGNKPQVIRERIQATYLGSKVDLFFEDSLTGWKFW